MWRVYIDTSGMPPEDIFIGMFLINDNYVPKFLTEFYSEFPELKHYNKKSTRARKETLFEVLRFFNEKRLRMACYQFKKHHWKTHERRINALKKEIDDSHVYQRNLAGFKERIMGVLYYYGITQLGVKSDEYDVTVCAESYADIWQVIDVIQKLARRDGWSIERGRIFASSTRCSKWPTISPVRTGG